MDLNKGINVVSLFDGMSCGQIALDKLGIKVNNYYASEIDKYAISVTQKNYPNTVQMGDVCDVSYNEGTLSWKDNSVNTKIDLLYGGSPCQSFSRLGDGSGFDGKSKLFWEYIRVLREVKPKYFLLENVQMKPEWKEIINKEIGFEPIYINSKLICAQNRPRLYWTNIPGVEQPKDKGLFIKDVVNPTFSSEYPNYLDLTFDGIKRKDYVKNYNTKSGCLNASTHKGQVSSFCKNDDGDIYKYTPNDCEALQTVPHNYTAEGINDKGKLVKVSNTQRYKMIGNGWTVDVIAHIFSNIS